MESINVKQTYVLWDGQLLSPDIQGVLTSAAVLYLCNKHSLIHSLSNVIISFVQMPRVRYTLKQSIFVKYLHEM
jgi:hypothetical protein